MIKALWDRFGGHIMFVGLVGLIFLGVALFSGYGKIWFPPKATVAGLDMKKIITYERTIGGNVLNVIPEDNGNEYIWVLWNELWLDGDPICPFVEAHENTVVIVVYALPAVVDADGEKYDGHFYKAVWMIYTDADGSCTSTATDTVLANPEILNWDWERH